MRRKLEYTHSQFIKRFFRKDYTSPKRVKVETEKKESQKRWYRRLTKQ